MNTKKIFMTGATGYLGVHLVKDLVSKGNVELHCLIRGNDREEAINKLDMALQKWEVSISGNERKKIKYILGDLEKENFGITDLEYENLCIEMDYILHNAAWVNWLLPVEMLNRVNVNGAKRIVKFATDKKIKKLFFVSSLSIFPFDGKSYPETANINHNSLLYGGYTQSKWLAETVINRAKDNGLDVTVFRPNLITGRSNDGVFSQAAFFENCLRSYVQLGAAPALDTLMAVVPVDYVSSGITTVIFDEKSKNRVYHFSNPNPTSMIDIVKWIQEIGYKIEIVPIDSWKRKLFSSADFPDNALYQFRQFVFGLQEGYMTMGTDYGTFTDQYMAEKGIRCHNIDKKLIATYVEYFQKSGFFDKQKIAVV